MAERQFHAPGGRLQIETASWRDLGSLRELERLCFPMDAWPLLDMLAVLTLPNTVRLKAMQDGGTVGFIAAEIRQRKGEAWIATLGVHPDLQRNGIGTALLLACHEQLDTQRIRLTVRASNQAAIHLYKNVGYAQVDTWKGYYKGGEDAAVMEKVLGG